MQITDTNIFPQIPQLPHLEYLYGVNGFWRKNNTLSYIVLNKIYDFIDSDFSISVINFIFIEGGVGNTQNEVTSHENMHTLSDEVKIFLKC